MGLYGADFIRQVHPQVIFPVPIHRKKKSVRGYNQAEVLAREISRGFSIPLRTDLVLRKKSTKAQKELSRKERKKNMERAFVVKKEAGMYRDILLVDDINEAVSVANDIASEHLEIVTKDPFNVMTKIKNAGAIFLGEYSSEPLGDYFAGPNHVLPTNGTAKFFSALSVDDFIKKSSIISYSREALEAIHNDIENFASAEHLTAHANSIKVRFE